MGKRVDKITDAALEEVLAGTDYFAKLCMEATVEVRRVNIDYFGVAAFWPSMVDNPDRRAVKIRAFITEPRQMRNYLQIAAMKLLAWHDAKEAKKNAVGG